jgi:glycosyltransferase involved in cell wall biosynthesis
VNAFVFPMQSGAGLQNKVLEAMYAGKPVVTSSIGNEGIAAESGVHIYIAHNLEEYVASIKEAISNGDKVGNSAREYVQKYYSSQSLANSFEKLLTSRNI